MAAPRPMKMATIASLWRYDAAAYFALKSSRLRRPAISHFACLPDRHANGRRPKRPVTQPVARAEMEPAGRASQWCICYNGFRL